jgi:hypothetical protein
MNSKPTMFGGGTSKDKRKSFFHYICTYCAFIHVIQIGSGNNGNGNNNGGSAKTPHSRVNTATESMIETATSPVTPATIAANSQVQMTDRSPITAANNKTNETIAALNASIASLKELLTRHNIPLPEDPSSSSSTTTTTTTTTAVASSSSQRRSSGAATSPTPNDDAIVNGNNGEEAKRGHDNNGQEDSQSASATTPTSSKSRATVSFASSVSLMDHSVNVAGDSSATT